MNSAGCISSGFEDGREWVCTRNIGGKPDEWFPPPRRTEPLGAISRRLGAEVSRQLGRRFTVRLRQYGFIELCDWAHGISHGFSWKTDEPADSPTNQRYLAGAVKEVSTYEQSNE